MIKSKSQYFVDRTEAKGKANNSLIEDLVHTYRPMQTNPSSHIDKIDSKQNQILFLQPTNKTTFFIQVPFFCLSGELAKYIF